jgi:hypothetical protein
MLLSVRFSCARGPFCVAVRSPAVDDDSTIVKAWLNGCRHRKLTICIIWNPGRSIPVLAASDKSAEKDFIFDILTGAASSIVPILSADPGTTRTCNKRRRIERREKW